MVAVVQLVEHQVVILAVAGSSPVSHPISESPSTQVGGDSALLGPDRLKRWLPTGDTAAMRTDRSRGILLATTLIAFVIQNSIAWPYARKHGLRKAAADFFKPPSKAPLPAIRFIYSDTYLMGTAFQAWAFSEARRLGILRWWAASVLVTFGVGAGTAVPFFLLVRDTAAARSHPRR